VKEKDAVVSNNFNLLFWLVAIPKIWSANSKRKAMFWQEYKLPSLIV
jgi:hypothetical protein